MFRILLIALALLVPTLSFAQPITGLYVGGSTGAEFQPPIKSTDGLTKFYTSTGPLGVLDLGWGFGNGLRAEIEGSYRANSLDGISTLRTNHVLLPLGNVGGSLSTGAIMSNLAYDFPLSLAGVAVRPYVGAGVGYGWVHASGTANGFGVFRVPENTFVAAADTVSFGTAGVFAYQVMTGVSVPLPFLPGLDATLQYRFFGTGRANLPIDRVATGGNVVNGVIPSARTTNGVNVLDHALLVGLRYTFGTPWVR